MKNPERQKEYFDSYTDLNYLGENLTPIFNKEILREYLSDLPRDTKILDFGCGNGKYGYTEYISELGYDISFTDISEKSVRSLANRMRLFDKKFSLGFHGDIGEVVEKLGANSYDIIFFGDVFHHLTYQDTQYVLDKLKTIIKSDGAPKGKIIAIEPNGKCPIWKLMPLYNKEFIWEIEKNIQHCTKKDFIYKFSKSGYRLVEYRYIRFLPIYLVQNYKSFRALDDFLKKIPYLKTFSQYALIVAEPL